MHSPLENQKWLLVASADNWKNCLKSKSWGVKEGSKLTIQRMKVGNEFLVHITGNRTAGICKVTKEYYFDERERWEGDKLYYHRIEFEPVKVPTEPIDAKAPYDKYLRRVHGPANGYFANEIRKITDFEFSIFESDIDNSLIDRAIIDKTISAKDFHAVKEILVNQSRGIATLRSGQDAIRKHTLKNYSNQCAMCDIDDPEILIASHIVPWSEEKATRGWLENVICLCVLHDALFEQGKITVNSDYTIEFSDQFRRRCYDKSNIYSVITQNTKTRLRMPQNTVPSKKLLMRHKSRLSLE